MSTSQQGDVARPRPARRTRSPAARAASRLAFLADASATLAGSLDYQTVLQRVVRLTIPILADWCLIYLVEPDGNIRCVATAHYDRTFGATLAAERDQPLDPAGPSDIVTVLRTGQPLIARVISDAGRATIVGEGEHLVRMRQLGLASALIVPLAARGQTLGALIYERGRASGKRYTHADLPLAQDLARLAALAIDNARLFREAELARQRATCLAQASRLLAGSLDVEATLRQVVALLAPALADLCVLDLRHADGTVERIVAGPDDTTYAALVDALIRCPPNPTQPGGAVATALRTGVAQYEPTTLTSLVDAEALDTDQRAALAGLAPISAIIAPVVARERQHGLLSLLFVGQERRSTAEDLVLAEELARTCALALDNALLYAAERQASASAQALARQREEFLAIAAHELKTPLTTVKGYVQLAGRFLAKPELDRERLLRILATLHVQVGRLEGLVGDLLDVGRLQHGQLALRCERLDLVALARQVLARFETAPERTEQHTLELDAAEPVTGLWDGHRLDQVLTNLLSNALKYSPAGGRVRVSIRHTADGQAEIAVSDQGIGIPPADRPLVFQPFGRGEHGSRQVAGVGLGLYITAQIVARHGGTIDLTSDPGVGSLFVVRLPLVGPAALSWRC